MARVTKVISGGQTGVDQAALRAAAALGIAIGGWCPPGRVCESGRIPDEFPLKETPEERSPEAPHIARSLRTEWNVRDSDATLVLCGRGGVPLDSDAGTKWAMECAAKAGKPLLMCDPATCDGVFKVRSWLEAHGVRTLNVVGPSEAMEPGVATTLREFLLKALSVNG
jgi:Circularly permutated YpsA SLOG family